jgi:hypothetical protein
MLNRFVVCAPGSGGREEYWTGRLSPSTAAVLTDNLNSARQFATAREAYDFAGSRGKRCRSLLGFHVGRRPTPVNLRSPY